MVTRICTKLQYSTENNIHDIICQMSILHWWLTKGDLERRDCTLQGETHSLLLKKNTLGVQRVAYTLPLPTLTERTDFVATNYSRAGALVENKLTLTHPWWCEKVTFQGTDMLIWSSELYPLCSTQQLKFARVSLFVFAQGKATSVSCSINNLTHYSQPCFP